LFIIAACAANVHAERPNGPANPEDLRPAGIIGCVGIQSGPPLKVIMFDKELLASLVCPENHQPLGLADVALLRKLNAAVVAGKIKNRAGQTVREPIQAGLVRADQAVVYPVIDDIPILLVDEAIPVAQLAD
jgi:uncharacterized protein YbaR (Trm112 family)